ncbi:hypothetical protein CROQUDRAFT_108118 [Cronartium quercuum f. sp. fusiforme G11]|uniref:Uncharacterized protein n=1 Tax=Cronartium quercuum f. sp. fusiforme G11 TaxID=708437 RepID=A0A9P6NDV6_9BASI|nr:hypothetical protein CROQUDRAFT_108118 [Cronartium quercuum f. sp. fusiforme G11]
MESGRSVFRTQSQVSDFEVNLLNHSFEELSFSQIKQAVANNRLPAFGPNGLIPLPIPPSQSSPQLFLPNHNFNFNNNAKLALALPSLLPLRSLSEGDQGEVLKPTSSDRLKLLMQFVVIVLKEGDSQNKDRTCRQKEQATKGLVLRGLLSSTVGEAKHITFLLIRGPEYSSTLPPPTVAPVNTRRI